MSENTPSPTPAPEGVPSKFVRADGSVDVGALAQSYRALERDFSSRPAPTSPSAPAPAPAPVDASAAFRDAQNLANQELAAAGRISEQTYARFQQFGIPREAVDAQVHAVRVQQETVQNSVYAAAGGKDTFETIHAWGRVNDPAKVAALQNALQSPDATYREYVVKSLADAYHAANGTQGRLLNSVPNAPQGSNGNGAQPFQSLREYLEAIKDPRWGLMEENRQKIDVRYRQEMMARLAATQRAGIDLNLRVMKDGQRVL